MPYSAVNKPIALAAVDGRIRLASRIAKNVMAVNGSPSSRLPEANPRLLGLHRLAAMPTAWIT